MSASSGLYDPDNPEVRACSCGFGPICHARSLPALEISSNPHPHLPRPASPSLPAHAQREKGVIVFTNPNGRFGFIRRVSEDEQIYFHFDSVAKHKEWGEPRVGDNVDFLVQSEGPRGARATHVLYLPDGTVEFETIIARGARGVVADPLQPPRQYRRGARSGEASGGSVRVTEASEGLDADTTVLPFHGRDVSKDAKSQGLLLAGEAVVFDVFRDTGGRLGATNIMRDKKIRTLGVVTMVDNKEKLFGFLHSDRSFDGFSDSQIYFRVSSVTGGDQLRKGDLISFLLVRHANGKHEAVRIVKEQSRNPPKNYKVTRDVYGTVVRALRVHASKRQVPRRPQGRLVSSSELSNAGAIAVTRYKLDDQGSVVVGDDGSPVTERVEVPYLSRCLQSTRKPVLVGDTVVFGFAQDVRGKILALDVRTVKEGTVASRERGVVTSVLKDNVSVFIKCQKRRDDVFAHWSQLRPAFSETRPRVGLEVEFNVIEKYDGKGRVKCEAIRLSLLKKGTVKFYTISAKVSTGVVMADLIGRQPTTKRRGDRPGALVRGGKVAVGRIRPITDSSSAAPTTPDAKDADGKTAKPTALSFQESGVAGFGKMRVVLLENDVVKYRIRTDTQTGRKTAVSIRLKTPTKARREKGLVIAIDYATGVGTLQPDLLPDNGWGDDDDTSNAAGVVATSAEPTLTGPYQTLTFALEQYTGKSKVRKRDCLEYTEVTDRGRKGTRLAVRLTTLPRGTVAYVEPPKREIQQYRGLISKVETHGAQKARYLCAAEGLVFQITQSSFAKSSSGVLVTPSLAEGDAVVFRGLKDPQLHTRGTPEAQAVELEPKRAVCISHRLVKDLESGELFAFSNSDVRPPRGAKKKTKAPPQKASGKGTAETESKVAQPTPRLLVGDIVMIRHIRSLSSKPSKSARSGKPRRQAADVVIIERSQSPGADPIPIDGLVKPTKKDKAAAAQIFAKGPSGSGFASRRKALIKHTAKMQDQDVIRRVTPVEAERSSIEETGDEEVPGQIKAPVKKAPVKKAPVKKAP